MFDDASQPTGISTALLVQAWDALPIPVCCALVVDGRIVYVNPAFSSLFGYEATDLTTIEAWARSLSLEPEQPGCCTHGQPQSLKAQPEPTEITVRAEDGADKTVLYRTSLLPDLGYVLVTFEDIAQRKQGELALREAEQLAGESDRRARILLAHSHELIIIAAGDTPAFASPGIEAITGWTEQEYVAQDLLDAVYPEDRAQVEEARRRILQDGLSQPLRYRTLIKGGGYRWVEGLAAPFRDPSARANRGYAITLRDIAKQKEQEDTLAMENSHLAQLAQLDELTGIANRRVFKSALAREARRRSRSSQALGAASAGCRQLQEVQRLVWASARGRLPPPGSTDAQEGTAPGSRHGCALRR